jgi:hypothetical protein
MRARCDMDLSPGSAMSPLSPAIGFRTRYPILYVPYGNGDRPKTSLYIGKQPLRCKPAKFTL